MGNEDALAPAGKVLFWPVGEARPDARHYLRAVPMPAPALEEQRSYYFVTLDEEREQQAEKEFRHRLGSKLRQMRGHKSRHEVALYLGRHDNTVAKFERGEVIPNAWEMLRLSRLFNCDVQDLYENRLAPELRAEMVAADIQDEFVIVPAAPGRQEMPGDQVADRFAFRRSWLQERGLDPEYCEVDVADSDAMASTILRGDILLINTRVRSVGSEGIHIIEQGGKRRCKRLQPLVDGGVKIRSDNERYETELVPPEHVNKLRVCGKVEWIGGVR